MPMSLDVAEKALNILSKVCKFKGVYVGYPKLVRDVAAARVVEHSNNDAKTQMFTIIAMNGMVLEGYILYKNEKVISAKLEIEIGGKPYTL